MYYTHPLFWLAVVTFVFVVGFGSWNVIATLRRRRASRSVDTSGAKRDALR